VIEIVEFADGRIVGFKTRSHDFGIESFNPKIRQSEN
jgi:hypothetical protein